MPRFAHHRFALSLTALLLGGLGTLSLVTYLRARSLIKHQIISHALLLTTDAVVANIEHDLLQPVITSTVMADNSLAGMLARDGQSDNTELSNYLRRIQQRSGAATAFLVSDKTKQYYHSSGVLKTITPNDPNDRWYQNFVDSGRELELNIDRDTADPNRRIAFVNVRLDNEQGQLLGVTGVGLNARELQEQLQAYQKQYSVKILLVNRSGEIVLASDQSHGKLDKQPLIGPLSSRILNSPDVKLQLPEGSRDTFIRTTRLPNTGLTVVALNTSDPEETAFHQLLLQNLAGAVLISVVLVVLAQATLGRDQKQLEHMARTDKLSGLLNRRQFDQTFEKLSQQTQKSGSKLAAVVMDIDHFKVVNDSHGHLVGDAVIRHVSRCISSQVRESDPVFRWGGEEFLLLLPGCDTAKACARLEAIRSELRNHPLDLAQLQDTAPQADGTAQSLPVTLSFGLAIHQPGKSSTALLQRADAALYTAKREGRDRICRQKDPA